MTGINLAAAFVFRLYGVTPDQVRLRQGKARTFHLSLAVSLIALIALVAWMHRIVKIRCTTARNRRRSVVGD